MAVSPFATIVGLIGDFISSALTWIGNVANVIVSTPVLLIFVVCVPLVGIGVGLFNRLIRSN